MGRFRFGIAFRLLAGLTSLVLLTVGASAVALVSVNGFERTINDIANRLLASGVSASKLVQETQKLAANAPQLMVAVNQYDRRGVDFQIMGSKVKIDDQLARLRESGLTEDESAAIAKAKEDIFDNLGRLDGAVERQIDLDHRTQELYLELRQLRERVRQVDGHYTENGDHDRLRRLVGSGEAAEALRLLDGETHLNDWLRRSEEAITLLSSTLEAPNKGTVDTIRLQLLELFERTQALLPQLPGTETQAAAKDINVELRTLALDDNGLLDARVQTLETERVREDALKRNRQLAQRLSGYVDEPVAKLEHSLLDISVQAPENARRTTHTLVGIVAACLVLSGLILLYINRNVVRRLGGLQTSIKGHLSGQPTPIDTRGSDEIAAIAKALDFFVQTISAREADLRQSEIRFRALVEGSLQGIVIHRRFAPVFANEAFLTMTGATGEAGIPTLDCFLGDGSAAMREVLDRAYATLLEMGGTLPPRQIPGRRLDGKRIWFNISDRVVDWGGQPAVQTTLLDVTEQVQAQAALQQKSDQLGIAIAAIPAGLQLLDRDLEIVVQNDRFREMLKLPAEIAAPGRSFAQLLDYMRRRGDFLGGETESHALLDRIRTALRIAEERVLADGTVVALDGLRAVSGGFALTTVDITQRKQTEEALRLAKGQAEQAVLDLQAAQASLVHAEKLASLGQLTAGIAHEIKNPLNFVNNFSLLSVELLDELRDLIPERGEEVAEIIDLLSENLTKIRDHGRRADGIVRSMLLHSRGGSGDRQETDINKLVDEAVELAYHGARATMLGATAQVDRTYDAGAGSAEMVPQDVMRVFVNLLGNAFYATRKRQEEAGPGYEPRVTVRTIARADRVEIEIRDNGIGMTPEVRTKLFTPFFTTKPTGEGTGLGLSLSWDIIVHQHRGHIAVESVPLDHTSFLIQLPRTGRAIRVAADGSTGLAAAG